MDNNPPSAADGDGDGGASLQLLDPSGTFLVEAMARIEDRTKPALLASAVQELNSFRQLVKGAIDLRVPERLSLDTRVKT